MSRKKAGENAGDLVLLNTDEMARADRFAITHGTPGQMLMERAGEAVAEALRARWPEARRVLVLAGSGKNGGDGFVAARHLVQAGREVRVALLGARDDLAGDAARAAERWTGPVEPLAPEALEHAEIVVDAIFGAGLARPVGGLVREVLEQVSARDLPVVAVDVPSGVDGTTGAVRGYALGADLTVTFFRLKPGHLLLPGRALMGEVICADIGIPGAALDEIGATAWRNAPALWSDWLSRPGPGTHKYRHGHAVVRGGGAWRTGASRLAAVAALRTGAGLVTLACPRDALAVNGAHLTTVMLAPCDNAVELAAILSDWRKNAVLLGPGGGVTPRTRAEVLSALSGEAALVLDADAITAFADEPDVLLGAIAQRRAPVVLTPHEGEFTRLFPDIEADGASSKLARTRAAAERARAVVLLKGADTVVAAPDKRAVINDHASDALATAGTGDVLAGIVLGLLARGMPAFEAASAAAWLHGAAGLRLGEGLIAEDLPPALSQLRRERIWESP